MRQNCPKSLSAGLAMLQRRTPATEFCGLSLVRRDRLDFRTEYKMRGRIHGAVLHERAGRLGSHKVVSLPVRRGSDRAYAEAAAATGANVFENSLDACRAERALEAADSGVEGVGRQRLVAVLACRPELEHGINALKFAPPRPAAF